MSKSRELKSVYKPGSQLVLPPTLDQTWQSDAKMSVLLNNFRPRQVNAEHYDQKMKFWREMIENYCECKGSPKCSIHELKNAFKRNGTVPYCLQEVFTQLLSEGNLVRKDEFMQQPKTMAGWALNSLLVKPLSWGFGKLKEKLISTSQDEQTEFVLKPALVNQSELLLEHVRSKNLKNNLISLDELMSDEIVGVAKDGILLNLQYLCTAEKKVFIEEEKSDAEQSHHHKLLLKFADYHKTVTPITEMERSIYNLERTEKFLVETLDKKEQLLNDLISQVRSYLKDGKKQMAKTLLRKKHMLESDLIKTMDVLNNVQTMSSRVQTSTSDKEILNTYKMGSDAIKAAFAESGINLDSVDDIIDNMREVYADQEEFERAISEPMRGNNIDDSDLEKELNELMELKNDDKSNNAGGNLEEKKPQGMNVLDQELEMRLRRLRSDLSNLDDPKLPDVTVTKRTANDNISQ